MPEQNLVFRNTAQRKGRALFATPQNSPLRYLSCGRIILDSEIRQVEADSGEQEVGLICIRGEGIVTVNGKSYGIKQYDALYIPPQMSYKVSTDGEVDLAECLAPSTKRGQPQFISFESVKNDPELAVEAGGDTYRRTIYKLIDRNVPASRLLVGITFGKPGNWTSWCPHEHARSKEEVYLYINMPRPAYGIQLMYDDAGEIDFLTRVFENDAVVIHKGYHPNVGIPGYGIKFVWMMAAFRPHVDREWTDMHFEEPFAGKY